MSPKPIAPNLHIDRSQLTTRMYRNIGWSFLIGTALLAGAVVAFSFGWATIIITPRVAVVTAQVTTNVQEGGTPDATTLSGNVEVTRTTRERVTTVGTEEVTGTQVEGPVVLINTTATERVLVATTRLLAPDGRLYRLTDRVTIPAKGETTALAHADKDGADYEIQPTKFTIPGLPTAQQKSVYAESRIPLMLKRTASHTVSATELDAAKSALLAEITHDLNSPLAGDPNMIRSVTITQADVTHSAAPDATVGSFTTHADVTATVVMISKATIAERISQALTANTPSGTQLTDIRDSAISITVEQVDPVAKRVAVRIRGEGTATITADHPDLDRKRLVSKNRSELEAILVGIAGIDKVELRFSPPWMERTPINASRIRIQILQ